MKSTLTLFLAAASTALAQNLSGQPPCATPCIITAITSAGCAPSDMGCQCGPTQTAIAAIAAPCLIAHCGLQDLLQAQSAGEAQCSHYSATRSASPPSATPAGTTTAAGAGVLMKNDIGAASSSGCGHGGGSGMTTSTATTTTTTAGSSVSSSTTASGTRTVVTAGAVASAVAQPAVVVGAGALLGVLGVAVVL